MTGSYKSAKAMPIHITNGLIAFALMMKQGGPQAVAWDRDVAGKYKLSNVDPPRLYCYAGLSGQVFAHSLDSVAGQLTFIWRYDTNDGLGGHWEKA